MRSIITIQFKRINRIRVNEELLKRTPNLLKSTEKTINILCKQIEKYFLDHKIEVEVKGELYE